MLIHYVRNKKAAAGADPVPTYLSTNVAEGLFTTSHTHSAMSTSGHTAGEAIVVIIYNTTFVVGRRPSAVTIGGNSLAEVTAARTLADLDSRPNLTVWYGTSLTLGSTSDVVVTYTDNITGSVAVIYSVADFTSIVGYSFVDTSNSQTATFTVSVANGDAAILGVAALADGRTYNSYATVSEDFEGDYDTSNTRPYAAASVSGLTTNASLTMSASLNSAFDRNNGSLVVIS